jgi:hypothetical protein
MLETGIKGKKEITVTQDKTAKAMGSGSLSVYATPRDDCTDGEHRIRECSSVP